MDGARIEKSAMPGADGAAKTVAVSELTQHSDGLRMTLTVAGEPDLVVIIAPGDAQPAWAKTPHLAIRFMGSTLSHAQEQALRLVAARLQGISYERLCASVRVTPSPAGPKTADEEQRSAEALRGQEGGQEAATIEEWGSADRWRTFMFRREFRRNATVTGWVEGRRVITVAHDESECQYPTPCLDGRTVWLHNYPWARWLEPSDATRRRNCGPASMSPAHISTDLRDVDVITGGMAKLEAALEWLAPRTDARDIVIVRSSCVPQVIGDDVEGAVARWRGRGQIRYEEHADSPDSAVLADLLRAALSEGEPGRDAEPSVSIAGLTDTNALDELRAILSRAGIAINCALIPAIDLAAARRWRAAQAQVLIPNPYYSSLYEQTFATLGMKTLSPPAPYGLAATKAWLCEVAAACEREPEVLRAWAEAEGTVASTWARLREDAAGLRLGFVLAANDYPSLTDPQETAGIPALDLLVELGFKLAFLVYAPPGCPSPRLALKPPHEHVAVVEYFSDQASLAHLLRSDLCASVYSDLYADERITAAGKAPFSLQFFEAGLRGCLRSAERLVGACRIPFYAKYGRHGRA
jgi:hypothetical protein